MKLTIRGKEYLVKVIDDARAIRPESDIVGIDIETNPDFDLDVTDKELRQHGTDPRLSKVVLAQICSGSTVYILPKNFRSAKDLLEDKSVKKLLHTASFEFKQFLHHYGINIKNIVDVEILEGIVEAGRQSRRSSLKDIVEKHLGEVLDKDVREDFIKGMSLSRQMVEYAAKDAVVLEPVYAEQMKLSYPGMGRVAELEFGLVPAVSRMELAGMGIDVGAWKKVFRTNKARMRQVEQQLSRYDVSPVLRTSMFGTVDSDLNFNSQIQKHKMLEAAGVDDISNLEANTLAEFYEKTKHPLVKLFLDHAKYKKLTSTYGKEFLDSINPVTGRIHQHIRQVEARTGRLAGRSPNLMNIPKKNEEYLRFRKCFIPSQPVYTKQTKKQRVFCVADYSGQELRILAEVSGDKRLAEAFERGIDVHLFVARILFRDKTIKEKDPRRRSAKNFNFGLLYGMGAEKLAKVLNCTLSEAKDLMKIHASYFSKTFQWTNDIGEFAKENGYVSTILGRRRYSESSVFDSGTIARNTPIQGTAADITKIAVYLFDKKIDWPTTAIVDVVHDEIIVETYRDISVDVLDLLGKTMIRAAETLVKSVPFDAEGYISRRWYPDGSYSAKSFRAHASL